MNYNLTPANLLTEFVLEQIETQPIEKRVALYRALAYETKDSELAKACRENASTLDRVLSQHQQLVLKFRTKAAR